ncbi:hypothetical protein NMY22_g7098 [Coprinellus aureogranulatus]|nr:hypothetical protein NMY22_g7098 [Coprinellus aureogranulatus]
MDRILPELIPEICACMPNQDLLSMALASSSLMKPALDVLWKDIYSFKPLACCLPAGLLKAKGKQGFLTYHLTREINTKDLERYLHVYAPRIRLLRINHYNSSPVLSSEALQGLQIVTRSKPGALSPNIKTLHWPLGLQALTEVAASYISLFVGDDLLKLSLISRNFPLSPLCRTELLLIGERLNNLKNLTFDCVPAAPSFCERFITAYSWHNLESLEVATISQDSLDKIVLLPRLAELKLGSQQDLTPRYNRFAQGPTYLHPPGFSSLKKLTLDNVESISVVIALLQHLSPGNKLQDLTVYAQSTTPASLDEIRVLFATIKEHCNPLTLEDVSLTLDSEAVTEETVEVDVDEETDISPLFSFPRLKSIFIWSLHRLRFGPPQIREIIASLPVLESLAVAEFGSSNDTTVPPQVTFEHVAQLVHGMPRLQDIRLRFDATQIRGDEMATGAPFTHLQSLDVDMSPILSPSRVSRWIRANFPRLHTLDHSHPVGNQSIYATRWEAVQGEIDDSEES